MILRMKIFFGDDFGHGKLFGYDFEHGKIFWTFDFGCGKKFLLFSMENFVMIILVVEIFLLGM